MGDRLLDQPASYDGDPRNGRDLRHPGKRPDALAAVDRCALLGDGRNNGRPECSFAPAADSKALETNRRVLESAQASEKQKMAAMDALYSAGQKDARGQVHVQLNDGGKPRDFVISREEFGSNCHITQLFAAEGGKNHPVLRGLERNGRFDHQVYNDGRKANFTGDWWSQNVQESTVGKCGAGITLDTRPDPRPEPRPEPRPDRGPEPRPIPDRREPDAPIPPRPDYVPNNRVDGDRSPDGPIPSKPVYRPDSGPVTPPRPYPMPAPGPDSVIPRPVHPPRQGHTYFFPPRRPGDSQQPDMSRPDQPPERLPRDGVTVDLSQRSRAYTPQHDSYSCSTTAMANVWAFQRKGSPASYGEVERFKANAGSMLSSSVGWQGGPNGMASMFERQGMHARPYNYSRITEQTMSDLNRELAQGHSAVIQVRNPHTGHGHYIAIYGRDASGNYILGDPDRHNNAAFGHDRPVSASWVYRMMSPRNGFVAAW